jgi:hypothetical protein
MEFKEPFFFDWYKVLDAASKLFSKHQKCLVKCMVYAVSLTPHAQKI